MTDEQQFTNPVPEPLPANRLRRTKLILSSAALILGIATIIVTLASGGGAQSRGILLGGILALMAGLRLFLTLRHDF